MKKTTLVALLALKHLPRETATAQEGPAEKPGNEAGRYFARPLDLWKAGLSFGPAPQPSIEADPLPSRVALRESVWAQPIRTPDGTWMIYVPPKQVLDFLESPSEETAKSYLHWKQVQAEKLKKAMELLAQVKDPAAAGPAAEAASPTAAAEISSTSRDRPYRITYFKRPSCPHCVSQDVVLAEWLKRRPAGTLNIVTPGDRPELWKSYSVRGTPTLVVEVPSRNRKEILVGLQSADALDACFVGQTDEGVVSLPSRVAQHGLVALTEKPVSRRPRQFQPKCLHEFAQLLRHLRFLLLHCLCPPLSRPFADGLPSSGILTGL